MARTKIDTTALHRALDNERMERHLSWRGLAGEIGVTPSTLSRLRAGYKPDAEGFMTLVLWLGLRPEDFVDAPPQDRPARQPCLAVELELLLRSHGLDEASVLLSSDLVQMVARHAEPSVQHAIQDSGERE